MYRQNRIKQMSQTNSVRFRNYTKNSAISIKTPWPSLLYNLNSYFILTIKKFTSWLTVMSPISKIKNIRSKPFYIQNSYKTIRYNTAY